MARKKPLEIVKEDTPVVKVKRPRIKTTTVSDASNVIEITDEASDSIVESSVVEEVVEIDTAPIVNPWVALLEDAERLYANIDEQYQLVAQNEVSSMLILMSSVIKSLKKKV